MIYDKNGNQLQTVYGKDGQPLSAAYSKDGTQIYPDGPITLKVMTYNVGQWYYGSGDNVPADKDAAYYALQNGMIQAHNPDVLCIQEYWKVFSKTGRTALSMLQQYFPYIHEQGGNSGYFGRCICSKYPISNYTVRTYANESNRYYDSCTITVNGVPITFTNTHLDVNSQDKRDEEIVELIAYLQTQQRFIACGDYNTAIMYADKTRPAYIKNIKPYLDAGFHVANCDDFGFLYTASDMPTGTWNGCLDNIITSPNMTFTSVEVDETKRTDGLTENIDHMPLIAVIEIP